MNKKLLLVSILLALIAFLSDSCSPPPCESIDCVNGFCEDGDCICEQGYTGSRCQTPPPGPPIANFSIENNGCTSPCRVTLTNSSTNASTFEWDFGDGNTSNEKNPTHIYLNGGVFTITLKATGEGGSDIITKTINIEDRLTKARITHIKVTGIPFSSSSGGGWDPGSDTGPDVYIRLQNASSSTICTSGTWSNMSPSDIPATYTMSSWCTMNPITNTYIIRLYDDDGSSSDYLGGYNFKPANSINSSNTNAYPDKITLSSNSSSISMELSIEWE